MYIPLDAKAAKRNLEAATAWFSAHGEDMFPTIKGLDGMTLEQVQALSARGNLFGAAAVALRETGFDIGTSINQGPLQISVSEVMNALGMDKDKAHGFACYCMTGSDTVKGHHAAASLRNLAAIK